jgi:hypothetical protein
MYVVAAVAVTLPIDVDAPDFIANQSEFKMSEMRNTHTHPAHEAANSTSSSMSTGNPIRGAT